jgi:hypothetical protein
MTHAPAPSRFGRCAVALVSAAILALASTQPLQAQGSCSVPQAGPGSVFGQGVGSLLPGQGWVQGSIFSLHTENRFTSSGSEEALFNQGRLDLQSFLITGAVGVVTGLEVWGQLVLHSLDFREVSGSRSRTGLGDARLWLRAGPRLLGVDESQLPVWVGLRAGVKLPASEFPIDAQVIPLTEGQKDAELALEMGRVFGQGKYVLQGWAGLRWRAENREAGRRPGNEWFGYMSGSVTVGPFLARLAAQTLKGSPYEIVGIRVPTTRREMFELFPSISTTLGRGVLEIGSRVPVAGRNLPTGNALTIGYVLGWGGDPRVKIEDLFPGGNSPD